MTNAYDVTCPGCLAVPGEVCRTRLGRAWEPLHVVRFQAAGLGVHSRHAPVRGRILAVEVDADGRPISVDGVLTPEARDPRYGYAGLHTWTCPKCGYQFAQDLGVILHVHVTHVCGEADDEDDPVG